MKICPRCKAQNSSNARFCVKCGYKFMTEAASHRNMYIIIVSLYLIPIVVTFVFAVFSGSSMIMHHMFQINQAMYINKSLFMSHVFYQTGAMIGASIALTLAVQLFKSHKIAATIAIIFNIFIIIVLFP